ncbi:hypothetical protein [Streptomyces sp. V1I6]|uniref:hypothetical protein n=1 Tax=Streptomyces sp. V1I6 TaxID=3042273 RepID=UPI0027849BD7|nr:hypothetical protein [Streptomyces sp. V1I6]MDQ0847592.1 hypothetical protein [Streptomyces sp. V1I6]
MTDHNDKPKPSKPAALAAVRDWWNRAWDEDGVLHSRWQDIRTVREDGWHGMAHWLKAVVAIAAACAVIVLLDAAAGILAATVQQLLIAAPTVQIGTDTTSGVWGVIDNPVRAYITGHSTGLAVSASTIYTVWQAAGLVGLIGGILRSTGARLLWLLWGATTIATVWTASPDNSRTVATGIAVLAWALASVLALRGLSLRPTVITTIHNGGPNIRPAIHIPAQPAPPADEAPGNIRPFTKR